MSEDGVAAHATALAKHSLITMGGYDEALLTVLVRTAPMAGINVRDEAYGDLFRDLTGGVLRGCISPYLEGSAEQAREQAALVASKHPLPAATEAGEEADARRQQHTRAVLQGGLDVFGLRSSVGRRAREECV